MPPPIVEENKLESGCFETEKPNTNSDLQPFALSVEAIKVVAATPILLQPIPEEVKVWGVNEATLINPVPKPQRTFTNGSQNSISDESKSEDAAESLESAKDVTYKDDTNQTSDTKNHQPDLKNLSEDWENQEPIYKTTVEDNETDLKPETKPLLTFKNLVEFIPPPFPTPQTPRANSQVGKYIDAYFDQEYITTSYVALFFVCFNLFSNIGLAVWHANMDNFFESVGTIAIILVSGIIVEVAFFCNPRIPKIQIWQHSKIVSFLSIVPCFLPLLLATSNIVFATKELRNRSYVRPWRHTSTIFLVESLSLAFPQCVLQLCILMENGESIPSAKGFFIIFSIFVMANGMTFARVRYDSATKPDLMEHGIAKCVRFAIFFCHKLLWIVTLACVIISFRLYFKSNQFLATIGGILLLFIIYEIPLIVSTLDRYSSKISGNGEAFFFLLPQFVSLTFLIFWVNMDANIYHTNIGTIVLGVYFWIEMIVISGWLFDSSTERESNFITTYPHSFASAVASCR